jgi:hypothetical protein
MGPLRLFCRSDSQPPYLLSGAQPPWRQAVAKTSFCIMHYTIYIEIYQCVFSARVFSPRRGLNGNDLTGILHSRA